MMPPPCLHVGIGKTATTTLQNHVFAVHPDIEYLGRPYRDSRVQDLIQHLVTRDSIAYDAGFCRALFDESVSPRLSGAKPVVLSEEGLTFNANRIDRRLIAERLSALFGPGKILITVRNQLTAIESYYINHGRRQKLCPACHGTIDVPFDYWIADAVKNFHRSYLAVLKYFELARAYGEIFGRANVRVLLFEDFVTVPERFLAELCDFIGVGPAPAAVAKKDANPRVGGRALRYQRLRGLLPAGISLARLVPAPLEQRIRAYLAGGAPAKVSVPEAWRARIADLYGDSNRRLAGEFGLPLAAHGYPGFA